MERFPGHRPVADRLCERERKLSGRPCVFCLTSDGNVGAGVPDGPFSNAFCDHEQSEGSQKLPVILSVSEGSRMVTLDVLFTGFFVAYAPENDRRFEKDRPMFSMSLSFPM